MKAPRPSRPAKANVRPAIYVLSTHWDREWYQSFQLYRQRLVHLVDRAIDDLATGTLRGPFTTDGQAILLEDYLEVRPEREAQVRRLVRRGQLKVGPWFVLPDEWLVSGESIIRNLQLGRKIARDFGAEPSNAGFVCDLFGHVSQLPQIFAGFGLKGALVWRGIEPTARAHFWWQGADGTRLACYRFPRTGYCDYAADVRHCTQHEVKFDRARADRELDAYLKKEGDRSDPDPILVFDGGDHLEYDLDYYRALFARRTGADFPYELKHGTLDDYLEAVLKQSSRIKDVVTGELRATGGNPNIVDQQWLIPGVLSSRVWIKQANVRCQHLLCHWAEPFGALASALCGVRGHPGFLDVAWHWLLMNHPHDSICGCSIDAVHEDMKYRFAQCEQIGDATTLESLQALAASVQGEVGAREVRVLVANPLTRVLDETVELTLQIPVEWGCFNEFFGFEPKPGFRVFAADGTEVPYQRLAQDMNRGKIRIYREQFPQGYRTNDITVALRLAIPALGYTTLTVREGEATAKDNVLPAAMLPTRHPAVPGLATSERSMENEHLSVSIEPNGTLTLTDKRGGETYRRLLTFEDIADIGDGWYHGEAANDQAFVSTASASDVALVSNGPLLARFRVRTTLRVPVEFRFDRMVRSEQLGELVIESLVTLRRGADRLEVRTTVQNQTRDHRLRVLLPTGAQASTYLADSAFDVVERPIALPTDNHSRRELAVETCAQQSWTAVADGQRGLAVVAPGLMETAVRDLPDRTLALTLFRATRRTVFTDGQPNGQLQGELVFNYWIVPGSGATDRVALCEQGIQLGAGLRAVQLGALDVPIHARRRDLPAQGSFLAVAGGAVVSSTREHGGGLEVRMFNPGTEAITVTCDFRDRPPAARPPRSWQRVNLDGAMVGRRGTVTRGVATLELKAKEIATVRFAVE